MRLPNGFGSITKLSGNRRKPFVVRKSIGFDEDGKQLVKLIGTFAKRTEALNALLEYNKDSSIYNGKEYTFERAYNAFTDEKYTSKGVCIPNAYTAPYKRCTTLYKVSLCDIKVIHLKAVLETCPTEATKRDCRTLLNQVFKWAIKNEIVEKNPVDKIDAFKIEQSEIHQPFTLDEIKTLWKHKAEYAVKIWLIYIYTGLRPTELRLIRNEDIHLDDSYMIGGIKNDISKNRFIPIADCIKPLIQELSSDNFTYLVHTQLKNMGEKPISRSALNKMLMGQCDMLNMKHLPHDSRHTTGTLLTNADVPVLVIQHILGHSPTGGTTGKVYVHKDLTKMIEAVNKLPHYA